MKTKLLGLIGFPLTHSFSEKYFAEKFRQENIEGYEYRNFELKTIDSLPKLLQKQPNIIGLNVTIPHKESVLKYVDEFSETVQEIGAANTLVRLNNGRIKAYNTDVYGFRQSILPFIKPRHKKALILGTGGAAKAVAHALKQLQIEILFVSRMPQTKNQIGYEDLNETLLNQYLIVVNTTPLGTFPNVQNKPDFPYHFIKPEHLFYDLVYNPTQTAFLKAAEKKGASISNGLNMLYLQAEKAWQIWLENSSK